MRRAASLRKPAVLAAPGVQADRRRLHHETRGRVRRQVERDLVRRAGRGRHQDAAPHSLDRPVQVAAQHRQHCAVGRVQYAARSVCLRQSRGQ